MLTLLSDDSLFVCISYLDIRETFIPRLINNRIRNNIYWEDLINKVRGKKITKQISEKYIKHIQNISNVNIIWEVPSESIRIYIRKKKKLFDPSCW